MSSSSSELSNEKTRAKGEGRPLLSIDSDLFADVEVALDVQLGRAAMSVREVLALAEGSVVPLDLRLDEPVSIRLNDATIARGEIVAVNDCFGIRITEIVPVTGK